MAELCYKIVTEGGISASLITDEIAVCGAEPRLLLVGSSTITDFTGCEVILILTGEPARHIRCENIVAVIADEQTAVPSRLIDDSSAVLIDCGPSPRATITFSSIGESEDIVCIQRTITANSKILAEPMEIAIPHCTDTMAELFCTAIKLFV